jgi:uncharacterized protein (DUF1330 family)
MQASFLNFLFFYIDDILFLGGIGFLLGAYLILDAREKRDKRALEEIVLVCPYCMNEVSDETLGHCGESSAPAYVVVQVTVEDPVTYERYKQLAPPSIALYGGRYLARGGETTLLEGSWQPNRLVILEFESVEQAKRWWASPEYAEAKALRQRTARSEMLVIPGVSAP